MHSGVVKDYFVGLQDNIVSRLEELDGTPFRRDSWNRPQGGGGISRLVEQLQSRQSRRHRQRIARQRASLVNRAERRDLIHY